MGAQHSTVGRAKSLDEDTVHRYQNAAEPSSSSSSASVSFRRNSGTATTRARLDRDKRSKSTLVIVNKPSDPLYGSNRLEDDPLFKKLQDLPAFVSLMHDVDTSSNIFGAKSRALADIRAKINPVPFTRIVRLYEDRLRRHADSVNVEQGRISKCIRENDIEIASIFKTLTDRQKRYAKHAENVAKLVEESRSGLYKCQIVLKECERNLQILNGFLPIEERLEPFSWPGLFDEIEEKENEQKQEDQSHSESAKMKNSNYQNNICRNELSRQESDATEIDEDFVPSDY